MIQSPPTWTSLEIVKILVDALTPIMVLVLGLWVNNRLSRIEHLQWASQKVIEKRLSVFDELPPSLNDLLCYFSYVGCWKDLTPPEAVKLKRKLDKIAYVNAPLFSERFMQKYNAFINSCYKPFAGWGQDAKLRTLTKRRQEAMGVDWDKDWNNCFADESNCLEAKEVKAAYQDLMICFSNELGIGLELADFPSGQIPRNIR